MSRNDQGEKGEHQRKQQHTAATSDTHLGHIPALIAAFKMSKYLSNSHFCPNSICLRNSCLTHYWCVRFQHCYIPVSSAEKPLDLPLEIKSLGRKRTKKWESYTAFCLGALRDTIECRIECVCVCLFYRRGYRSLSPAAGWRHHRLPPTWALPRGSGWPQTGCGNSSWTSGPPPPPCLFLKECRWVLWLSRKWRDNQSQHVGHRRWP